VYGLVAVAVGSGMRVAVRVPVAVPLGEGLRVQASVAESVRVRDPFRVTEGVAVGSGENEGVRVPVGADLVGAMVVDRVHEGDVVVVTVSLGTWVVLAVGVWLGTRDVDGVKEAGDAVQRDDTVPVSVGDDRVVDMVRVTPRANVREAVSFRVCEAVGGGAVQVWVCSAEPVAVRSGERVGENDREESVLGLPVGVAVWVLMESVLV